MHIRRMRHTLAAAAALTGLPAFADITLPGTLCASEGPAERSLTGLMVNKATSLGQVTHFHCPIIRTQSFGNTLTVTVNAKTNSSNVEFNCSVRSVLTNNVTFDTSKMIFASSYYNNGYAVGNAAVALPLGTYAAVNMRCSVPNASSGEAGIVSYRIEQ